MLEKRPYQEECLESIATARLVGAPRALIVMATRLGKTITSALDIRRYAGNRRIRVLYLCHKTDILYQARLEYQRVFGTERTYGFFHGTKKDFENVDFLFATFDTLGSWLELFERVMFEYIVVDESHHSHAETYLPTIEYFKPKFLLAITATPDRMDEKDITEIFGKPIFNLPLEKALARGYLAPVDYRILTDEIQTDKIIATPDKQWSISALNRQIFVPKRDEEIVRLINLYTQGIKELKMIVFCSSVKHCDHLVTYLPDSLAFHSKIPGKERDLRLEMFRQEMLNTVVTVDCFNEGIDIPRANVIVFLRSTASNTIFLQQLGRGLTKEDGKDRVLVLDFVANLERIKMVDALVKEVDCNISPTDRKKWAGPNVPFTVEIGKVTFLEKKISMTDLLDRILKKEFYPTWQEASEIARKLVIAGRNDYELRYREDPRLPSRPDEMYADFPGYYVFLGIEEPNFYPIWQEASAAVIKLGIDTQRTYSREYRKDARLPGNPRQFYKDFPGWNKFLGNDRYSTWQEAAAAAKKLGVTFPEEYRKRYKEDPRLPSSPNKRYPDFPGWTIFFGREIKNFYPTWQEASAAALKLGIRTFAEYLRRYSEDPRLNSSPHRFYKDFPGGAVFLGKGEPFYETWQEASVAAQKLGFKGRQSYLEGCMVNRKLPCNPARTYGKNWPGWFEFLGKA
ncbi:MAG: DEAD/DEAH box helicase family protein [Patescibacteria group bacterium]|nr:DEAD/DEAH box helicase family protein [Patescibacteria group bacterium]